MTTDQPDLEDLALLVQVARLGSFGRAAQELGVSQPSVSRRIARLERRLRVPPLLSRSPGGSTLTPTGKVVVGWATTLLAAADHFTHSVASLHAERAVAVRAALSMTIAEHYAPGWLAGVKKTAPELAVSVIVNNSFHVGALVESGEADIGFLESPSVRQSLRRRRFAWDELAVAVLPDHEWAARRRPVSAAQLAATPLLVREPGSGTRETVQSSLEKAGFELNAGVVMASNTALKSAALAGMGPVVLSELSVEQEIASGQLVRVPVAGISLRRPFSVVWRREEPLGASVTTLLRVILGRHTQRASPRRPTL